MVINQDSVIATSPDLKHLERLVKLRVDVRLSSVRLFVAATSRDEDGMLSATGS